MSEEVPRGAVLHSPAAAAIEATRLADFARFAAGRMGRRFDDYQSLQLWSVEQIEVFWRVLWEYFDVEAQGTLDPVLVGDTMPGVHWFPGARVNYTRSALGGCQGQLAIIAQDESGAHREVSAAELTRLVAACRRGLQRLGVGRGDRVVAYLPNCVEAVVAFLATASLGAIWSSCPPEFGTQSVLDRFSQIGPKVLIATDGYQYGGKWFQRCDEVDAIARGLPHLGAVVLLPRSDSSPRHDLTYDQLLDAEAASAPSVEGAAPVDVEWVEFEHPLWILYSSGTTGKPKPIVHGHGGIILEHLKSLALHGDLGPGDRFFWFSTTGWMMWNYLVGGLLVGATIVLYEGNPAYPSLGALWQMAAQHRVTFFGTSAPFIAACRARGLRPAEQHDLRALRSVGSTGAPLSPEGFQWVYEAVSPDIQLASISGGTDMCTAFVTSCPWLPVRQGELQCSALGADVQAYDPAGAPLLDQVGELVIRRPMPSMPVCFWGDDDGSRYRESYFEDFAGVWRHGDWITRYADGAAVIHGRSDATLNRGGVRMGTAEFYRALEDLAAIDDCLVVEVGKGESSQLWLFVVLASRVGLDDELRKHLASRLRTQLSPRHVPDVVCAVEEIPYTLSGKKLELPVKRILEGASLGSAQNPGTQRNPAALPELIERAREARDRLP